MYFKKLGKLSGLETQGESPVHSEPIGKFTWKIILYFKVCSSTEDFEQMKCDK